MNLSARSESRLVGVHPDLVKVLRAASALCTFEIMVIEGVRTLAKQREYFAAGKSRTMRSRHLDGHAVDLAPILDTDHDGDMELSWHANDFKPIAHAMKQAAGFLNIPLEWGGEVWAPSFIDAPHFQLPWTQYPSAKVVG